jgi:HSP20 family protein
VNRDNEVRRLLQEFKSYSEEMEAISRDYFSHSRTTQVELGHGFLPSVDAYETETEFICIAEIPGVGISDLKVGIDGSALVIRGERKPILESQTRKYHRMELDFGAFERIITIPEAVIQDSLNIELINGYYIIKFNKLQAGFWRTAEGGDFPPLDSRR